MKGKKILFKIGGIVQIVSSAFTAFIGAILLLLRPIVNTLINGMYDDFQLEIKTFGEENIDESMRFLLDYSKEEFSAYFMKYTIILAIIILALAIAGLVLGIYFVKTSKKYEYSLANKKGKKIALGIITVLVCGISIPSILVIIALCLKDNKSNEMNAQVEVN